MVRPAALVILLLAGAGLASAAPAGEPTVPPAGDAPPAAEADLGSGGLVILSGDPTKAPDPEVLERLRRRSARLKARRLHDAELALWLAARRRSVPSRAAAPAAAVGAPGSGGGFHRAVDPGDAGAGLPLGYVYDFPYRGIVAPAGPVAVVRTPANHEIRAYQRETGASATAARKALTRVEVVHPGGGRVVRHR